MENKYNRMSLKKLEKLMKKDYSFEQLIWNAWVVHLFGTVDIPSGLYPPISNASEFKAEYDSFFKNSIDFMNQTLKEMGKYHQGAKQ